MPIPEKVKEVVEQWTEGAITYIEFVNWVTAQITEEDIKDYEQFKSSVE